MPVERNKSDSYMPYKSCPTRCLRLWPCRRYCSKQIKFLYSASNAKSSSFLRTSLAPAQFLQQQYTV